jgi:cysteine desulfurase
MRLVYLDNLAATRPHPDVVAGMLPYLGEPHYGNPSSPHRFGEEPQRAVEKARQRVARLIGADPSEILFTASGSESNNLAIKGLAAARGGRHIVTSAVEHLSILHPIRTLEDAGFVVTRLGVDRHGRVEPDALRDALRDDTILVSISHAVAEVGTLQPIDALASIATERGIPFHSDAVAGGGIVPFAVGRVPVSALSLNPGRFHGPKGVGVLFLRAGVSIRPLVEGGVQEGGLRAGSESVAGLVGTGIAADLARTSGDDVYQRLERLGITLQHRLRDEIPDTVLTGHPDERIPGHVSVCFSGAEGEAVLQGLDHHGIAAATGSACVSDALKDSYVLEAMGIDSDLRRSSLVFSFGRFNDETDIDAVLEVLPTVVERIRKLSPG